MPSNPGTNQYHSYLLRLWQIKENNSRSWRASLENTRTGELQGFPDLGALLQYLQSFDESFHLEALGTDA